MHIQIHFQIITTFFISWKYNEMDTQKIDVNINVWKLTVSLYGGYGTRPIACSPKTIHPLEVPIINRGFVEQRNLATTEV
jgi:hypothetical protein